MGDPQLNAATLAERLIGEGILRADSALNDSDKQFVVPSPNIWIPFSIWIKYTATVTAGTRQLAVEFITEGSAVVAQVRAGATQIASEVRYYLFSVTGVDLVAFRDTDWLSTALPHVMLPSGFKIRVYDKAAIDAAADDMEVSIMLSELIEA